LSGDGERSERRIRPVSRAEIQKAYNGEEFVPEEKVAKEVVDFVDGGKMAFVMLRMGRAKGDDGVDGKGKAVKSTVSGGRDLLLPPQSEVDETSTSFSTSSGW
jgi:hypothetical protein